MRHFPPGGLAIFGRLTKAQRISWKRCPTIRCTRPSEAALRAVEYQGEWICFAEYLKRRFNIETTHGMSPAEARKQIDLLMQNDRNA